MAIDFTGVSAVQIPEGNVTKVTVKDTGVVKWEKDTKVPVKITGKGKADAAQFTCNGVVYTALGTYMFEVGDALAFKVKSIVSSITLNGENVYDSISGGQYYLYTFVIPEGCSAVTVKFSVTGNMGSANITTT